MTVFNGSGEPIADLAEAYAVVYRCPMGYPVRQRELAERNGDCLTDGRCPEGCPVKNRNTINVKKEK